MSGSPSRETDVLARLGLARRAGAVESGVARVREAARKNRVGLVLLGRDAAEGQLGKLTGLMRARGIPFHFIADRKELGAAIGEAPRSAVAVRSGSFADQILERISDLQEETSLREHGGSPEHAGR